MDYTAIRQLAKLVEESNADPEGLRAAEDGTEPRRDARGARLTPASIGPQASSSGAPTEAGATATATKRTSKGKGGRGRAKNIWSLDEVPDAAVAAAAADEEEGAAAAGDGMEEPEYEFLYKQAVTANDAYLGMGEKDPSSTQCEDLVLRVHLPGVRSAAEVDLDVRSTHARLTSDRYRLFLYLPHTVDEKRGRAAWDARTGRLSVTLPIVRGLQ